MKIKTTYLEALAIKANDGVFLALPATWQDEINLVIDTASQLEHFLISNQSFKTLFISNNKAQNYDILKSINKLLTSRLKQLFNGDKKVLNELASIAQKIHFMLSHDDTSYVKDVNKSIRDISKIFTLHTGKIICPMIGKK